MVKEVYKYIDEHRILHPDGREFNDRPENSIWQELKVRIDAGDPDVVIEAWPFDGPDPSALGPMGVSSIWTQLRTYRNNLLTECDWVVTASDVTISDSKKAEWVTYRQKLRDIPTTIVDNKPQDVVWPTKPE